MWLNNVVYVKTSHPQYRDEFVAIHEVFDVEETHIPEVEVNIEYMGSIQPLSDITTYVDKLRENSICEKGLYDYHEEVENMYQLSVFEDVLIQSD